MSLRTPKINITKPELSPRFILTLVLIIIGIIFILKLCKLVITKISSLVREKTTVKDDAVNRFGGELGL